VDIWLATGAPDKKERIIMAYIELEHIVKTFKGQEVVKDTTLSLEHGQTYGITGVNGSGKTVLMKMICGLLVPDSGTIRINGKQLGKEMDFAPNTGIIIEVPEFLPYRSGYQNLMDLAGIRKKATKEDVISAIQRVGLDPNSRKRVGKYSLGMRQRLGIAQAIMEDPELLILDEPFNGLDEEGVEDIRKLLLELKVQGKTILISSHNKEDIEILCDQVFHMERGKITKVNE
jgi:ABC-2 type transport system ATP-binding protein